MENRSPRVLIYTDTVETESGPVTEHKITVVDSDYGECSIVNKEGWDWKKLTRVYSLDPYFVVRVK